MSSGWRTPTSRFQWTASVFRAVRDDAARRRPPELPHERRDMHKEVARAQAAFTAAFAAGHGRVPLRLCPAVGFGGVEERLV